MYGEEFTGDDYLEGGSGFKHVKYWAYEAGLSVSLSYLQNFYAEKTTSKVYQDALFKNPWNAPTFEAIHF